ncbi:glycosyltransferase [bacterium]|nr:glycosyltransferase [bacterium]
MRSAVSSPAAASGAPLRVGMVIGQLSTGGAEGQLLALCAALDPAVATPIVYCLSASTEPYGPLLERAGVPVRVLTGHPLRRARALRAALAADRIDVVHAWLFIADAYAWAATRCGGPRLVTTARNCKRSGGLLDRLTRRAFAASDAIIVNSRQVGDYIASVYGAPTDRLTVVYNAIDLDRFQPPPAPRPRQPPRIVMVGRLVQQKNPRLFVAAAAALRARRPDVRFRLVGDGPLRGEVEAAARAAGLAEALEMTGERRDVPALLQDADLFWLTSDWEGLPNAVLEAMACGLPVVATDVGGTSELVDAGVEGYVIDAGDRDALVARSLEILADPVRHGHMRQAARARAIQFSRAAMARTTQAVYARAVGGRA